MKARKTGRNYFTINIDEPYALQIYETMKKGEIDKGTWTEGNISFDEWKTANFSFKSAENINKTKDEIINEIKKLSESLPEELREIYVLSLEMQELEQNIRNGSYEEANRLFQKAASVHKTLNESMAIINSQKLFGTFLVEEGLATPVQIVNALDIQKKSTKSIGQIACEQKMLTPAQVLDIMNAKPEINKLFCETALLLGYLTNEQVEMLLTFQMKARQPIGAVLVTMGVLEQDSLEASLSKFYAHKEQSLS